MTAPRDCRPPEGTPDGTVCWLVMAAHGGIATTYRVAVWRVPYRMFHPFWELPGQTAEWAASQLEGWGWRFHSIAEPPHDQ